MDVKKTRIKKTIPKKGSYDDLTQQAVELFRKGWLREKIVKKIVEESNLALDTVYSVIVVRAAQILADEHIIKGEEFIGLHIERYNKDIESLLEKDYSNIEDLGKRISAEIRDKFELLNLLYQKEKFLQLHSKTTVIKLQNSKKKNIKINFFKLSILTKIKMLQIIDKSKGIGQLSTIITSKYTDKDIEEAEVVEETETNISKIKMLQISPASPIEEPGTLLSVTEKIRQALVKKAMKDFNIKE